MFGLRKTFVAFLAINITFVLCQENVESSSLNDDTTRIDQNEITEANTSPTDPSHGITDGAKETTVSSTSFNEENATTNKLITDDTSPSNYTETTTSSLTPEIISETTTASGLCTPNPCYNEGTCTEIFDDEVLCNCTVDYVGRYCETPNNCGITGELCKNGSCMLSKDTASWECQCFTGTYWDDQAKECKESTPPCFPNPCTNGGSCNALDGISYRCECASGHTGTTCEILDQCYTADNSQPCREGYCALDEQNKTKYCQCYEGYDYDSETKGCRVPNPPCFPNPCGQHGSCVPASGDTFNCTCDSGYTGSSCDILDQCPPDGCLYGYCKQHETQKIQYCQCKDSYFLDPHTKTCTEVQAPCAPNLCDNRGICTVLSENEFNCSCEEGYGGDKCSDRDLCILGGGTTFCKEARCITDNKSYHCDCKSGEYFNYAQRQCKPLDLCPLMACKEHETCKDSTCDCEHGFKRNNITDKCEPHFCEIIGCQATNSICTESTDGKPENFQCHCPKGQAFDGQQCTYIWCEFPSLNECEQKCDTVDDGYTCSCFDNFTLKSDKRNCEYTGEANCLNTACKNGLCVKENDIEKCVCPLGYTEDKGSCIDLCSAKKLPTGICPGDMCESVDDIGFRCQCVGKYQLSTNGVTCTLRKICSEGESGWIQCQKQNAVCVEDEGISGFKCICPPGFAETSTGDCKGLCDIDENDATCSKLGASCDVDYKHELVCRCPVGFKNVQKGSHCNMLAGNSYLVNLPVDYNHYRNSIKISKDSKGVHFETMDYSEIEHDVMQSMKQLFLDFEAANIIKCKMQKNHMLCKAELQFEVSTSEELKRMTLPSVCHHNDTISFKRCLIPPGLVLRKEKLQDEFTIAKMNICDDDIKKELCGIETTCSSDGKNFVCSCENGYRVRVKSYPLTDTKSYIEDCNDIDECEEHPCPEFTACVNMIGSFNCKCLTGYKQKDNVTDPKIGGCVELCTPSPCTHGECSKTGDHRFQCSCSAGYKGELCDLEDRAYKDAKMNTVIVGAVLGGILLITSLLFVSSVTRLRRKKYLKEPEQILYTAEMTERHPIRLGMPNTGFERDS